VLWTWELHKRLHTHRTLAILQVQLLEAPRPLAAGVASSLDTAEIAAGRDAGAAEVREGGRLVSFDQPFWFAVASFRPDIRIVGEEETARSSSSSGKPGPTPPEWWPDAGT
jgi:hypothetical protein